jgi:hypothetical protein
MKDLRQKPRRLQEQREWRDQETVLRAALVCGSTRCACSRGRTLHVRVTPIAVRRSHSVPTPGCSWCTALPAVRNRKSSMRYVLAGFGHPLPLARSHPGHARSTTRPSHLRDVKRGHDAALSASIASRTRSDGVTTLPNGCAGPLPRRVVAKQVGRHSPTHRVSNARPGSSNAASMSDAHHE